MSDKNSKGDEKSKDPWAFLGKFVAFMLLWPLQLVFRAAVAKAYWGWFISPAFNVPTPTYATCYGVMGFLFIAACRLDQSGDKEMSLIERMLTGMIFYLLAYFIGWLAFTYGGYFG